MVFRFSSAQIPFITEPFELFLLKKAHDDTDSEEFQRESEMPKRLILKYEYIYYIDDFGKEWGVFIRKWGKTKYYELRTAYRADCGPPFRCKEKEFNTILEKWLCEGFEVISLW